VTSCIVDSAAIYIMVVKIRNTICPPQPQLSLHRRAALSSDSNGTRSYIAERTQSEVYIVRCLWPTPVVVNREKVYWSGLCPLFSCSVYVPSYKGVVTSIPRSNILPPPPCYIGKYTMPSPYRREELLADTATLVYLLSGCEGRFVYHRTILYAVNRIHLHYFQGY
jgi:hypothetical protein